MSEKNAPRLPLLALMALLIAGPASSAAEDKSSELEKQMFELVNKDREGHQKKLLEYRDDLAAAARAHGADMVKNSFFSHESPRTGKVADRVRAAKIRFIAVGENIATNFSIEDAQKGLMASPGHRENILSEVYTHCGIGIVQAANGTYYVTQVFAAPAPPVDLKTIGADILTRLNQARIAKGKLPFQSNAPLSQLAAEQAAALIKAEKPAPIDAAAVAKSAGLKRTQVSAAYVFTWAPAELADAEVLFKPAVGRIGFGFAENTQNPKLGYGIICAVVIFTND